MYKVCIDTGGAFTDCVVLDGEGRKKEYKAPSTPKDYSIGVIDSLREAAVELSMNVIPPGFVCSLDKYGTYILRNEN